MKLCRSCPKLIPSMPEPRCLTCRNAHDKKRAGYNEPWYRALKPSGDCFWGCGQPATERDHYIPLAEGGEHAPGNIVWACKPCNSSRRKYGRGDPRP